QTGGRTSRRTRTWKAPSDGRDGGHFISGFGKPIEGWPEPHERQGLRGVPTSGMDPPIKMSRLPGPLKRAPKAAIRSYDLRTVPGKFRHMHLDYRQYFFIYCSRFEN